MKKEKRNLHLHLLWLTLSGLLLLSSCNESPKRITAPIISNSTTTNPPPTTDPTVATRPDGAISFKQDFCACKDTKSIILSNCASFCSNKNTNGAEILFFNFTVSEAISLDSSLQTVSGWCSTPIGESKNPSCVLEAKGEDGSTVSISFNSTGNKNGVFQANIGGNLDFDKTYIVTLKETTSQAKSNSIQVRKISDNPADTVLGPLEITPVIQYSCILRTLTQDSNNGDIFYDNAFRYHFYFTEKTRPDPIPSGTSNLFCHDIAKLGTTDDITYPRLEESPGAFSVWNNLDSRFYDLDGTGTMDVNELIQKKVKEQGVTLSSAPNLFLPYPSNVSPIQNTSSGNNNTGSVLGYYMTPWIDTTTFLAYCPNQSYYYSSNAIFIALRDLVGVDTEGLYVAKREPEAYKDSTGATVTATDDFVFVRETEVKKTWFYLKNGLPTQPVNNTTLKNFKILFYYPYDFTSPYVKKSYQRTYTITAPTDVASGSSGTSSSSTLPSGTSSPTGVQTSYPTHDNRIGCVPVTTSN